MLNSRTARRAALGLILLCTATVFARQLVWDPNIEPDIAWYRVYQQQGGSTNITSTSNAFLTMPSLTPGASYLFWVTALNTNGTESLPSDSLSWTEAVATPPISPAITNAVWKEIGAFWSVQAGWTPLTNISSYLITLDNGLNKTALMTTNHSYSNAALPLGSWTIYVQSVGSGGTSAPDAFTLSPHMPLPPINLRLTP